MNKILNFSGQEAFWNEKSGVLYVRIKTIFNSAGYIYNWIGDKRGVGVNKNLIDLACKVYGTICVHILHSNEIFTLNAIDWRYFSEKTKSIYKVKTTGTRLYVIPINKMKKVFFSKNVQVQENLAEN